MALRCLKNHGNGLKESVQVDIRIVQTKDFILLAQLNHQVQNLHYDIEPTIFKVYSQDEMAHLFQRVLTRGASKAYVAQIDQRPVGYILISEKHLEETEYRKSYRVLYIEQICVKREFKGKGIGKELVKYAKEYAKDKGIKRLEMDYWSKNESSGLFFRGQGFKNYNESLCFELDD